MYANCPKCLGPMSTDSKCSNCDPVTITITPNITYTWVCPKCDNHCSMCGFCSQCGWWAAPPPATPTGWKCPGCRSFHGPHVDTCPFCQPIHITPYTTAPYVGDPLIYVCDHPNTTVTMTSSGEEYFIS